uniref:Uncharacterized protein n=1 Tax=Trichuris muris TaxID=70415 RepID=A0A5S6Q6F8_TRIMR
MVFLNHCWPEDGEQPDSGYENMDGSVCIPHSCAAVFYNDGAQSEIGHAYNDMRQPIKCTRGACVDGMPFAFMDDILISPVEEQLGYRIQHYHTVDHLSLLTTIKRRHHARYINPSETDCKKELVYEKWNASNSWKAIA